jgi:putative flippase GtrA
VVAQATVGDQLGYITVLIITTLMAVLFAYCGHRWLTFQVRGMWLLDLARFSTVYLVILALNILALPLLVEVVGLTPILAQSVFVVLILVSSYLSHRHFSFRRKS